MRLRKRKLEIVLSGLRPHPEPDAGLEQYTLTAGVAAKIVVWAWDRGDIEGRKVCDLGCGTGILAIGAALCGAESTTGIDLDQAALSVARENINIAEKASNLEIGNRIELKRLDVAEVSRGTIGEFETVVQNPPFGVQRRSSDRIFVRKALEIAPRIYSLHKRNPEVESFIRSYVEQLGGRVEDKLAIDLALPRMFKFHRKPRHLVETDLFMIRRIENGTEED
jgi:putative methylase